MAKIDREELRALVRQALKDALGAGAAPAARSAGPIPTPPSALPRPDGADDALRRTLAEGRGEVSVAVRTSDDLGRLARAVAEACAEPQIRTAILEGRVRFLPAGGRPDTSAQPAPQLRAPGAAYEMESGVLSETRLLAIARTHARINLGAGVVLTPLARDKAREMKIELARQKP